MIVQTIRNPGLAAVYHELFSTRGSGIHVEHLPVCAEETLGDIAHGFTNAIPIGLTWEEEREGTTYLQLLEETRCELGLEYMEHSQLPVTEIALMLGFAETSSFSRAFRRWTGTAPSQHRLRLSQPDG